MFVQLINVSITYLNAIDTWDTYDCMAKMDPGLDWVRGQARAGSGDLRSRAVSIGLSWGSNYNNQPLLVLHDFLGLTMSTRILVLFDLLLLVKVRRSIC
jgi:hypothetical protein